MTHILPPDKLRAIIVPNLGVAKAWDITDRRVDESIEAIQQLAADALVAKLRGLLQSGDASNAVATLHHNGAILDLIAQLTTVPDLPSEHETSRELGDE